MRRSMTCALAVSLLSSTTLLLDTGGTPVSYDELPAKAAPSLAKEVAPETWQARYEACQKGIATLAKTLEQIAPDILVIFGDDQEELFSDESMPAMLAYWGQEKDAGALSTLPQRRLS